MGKPNGFLEYERLTNETIEPQERIKNYKEFHLPMLPEKRKQQAARCMDCGVPFCQSGLNIGGMTSGCPLNNLVPEWNDAIYRGQFETALERLHKTNNFPEFTGRVCPALCEAACTCSLNGEAVSIKENEYSIAEYGYETGYIKPMPPSVRTGKKVAIIGSGPAGLAAADQLNKRGHLVTVYERNDRIGGLLMYGIPNMKLEKHIIDRRVALMRDEGVEFVTSADVGNTYSAAEILNQYDSVILACGASNPRDISVPGRETKGIHFAVDYLSATTKSLLDSNLQDNNFINAQGKNVLVIGGGDTGNDCVGTAIRQGCTSVIQLEMMPQPPVKRATNNLWPEWPKILKTDYGQEEAIAIFGNDPRLYQTTVKEFVSDKDGNLAKVIATKLEAKKDKNTGKISMTPIKDSEFEIKAELVLIAAGFIGSQLYVADAFGVELNECGTVKTDFGKHRTNVDKVFTAGDMHRGQSLVVWAIREGRETAREVDCALMGYSNLE